MLSSIGVKISDRIVYDTGVGYLLKGLDTKDPNFHGFEEVYFSEIKHKKTKGWRKHKLMTCNIIVISGGVVFDFKRENTKIFTVKVSHDDFRLITIPPHVWFRFYGVQETPNIICNIANLRFDETEIERENSE